MQAPQHAAFASINFKSTCESTCLIGERKKSAGTMLVRCQASAFPVVAMRAPVGSPFYGKRRPVRVRCE